MQALMKSLNELCDALPFQSSFYVKDLTTGTRGDRFGSVPVPSASTRKISILMAALAAVHAGKLTLDQKVTIESKYQDNDSGTFQHLTPGFSITLRDAMVMMIIVSDNTCTGIVVDHVGLEAIQRWCEGVGMTGTTHRFGIPPKLGRDHTLEQVTTTTPNDQGLLLEMILQGTTDAAVARKLGSTPELCRLGLDILSWQS
jgi:beta-lactamase class A